MASRCPNPRRRCSAPKIGRAARISYEDLAIDERVGREGKASLDQLGKPGCQVLEVTTHQLDITAVSPPLH